jgi:hypothetical protein
MASLLLPYVCLPHEEQGRDVAALVSLQYGELVEAMGSISREEANRCRSRPSQGFAGTAGSAVSY